MSLEAKMPPDLHATRKLIDRRTAGQTVTGEWRGQFFKINLVSATFALKELLSIFRAAFLQWHYARDS